MVQRAIAIGFFYAATIFVFCSEASAIISAKELLMQSSQAFDKGQYQKALWILRDINIRQDLDNSDDMKLAFKIRAISYEETKDIERAKETIRELFFLDQNYQFNPFDTPIAVVELAQKEKSLIEEKNTELLSVKTENKALLQLSAPMVEKTILIEKRPPFVTTLFPLGLNHFYLGSPIKGAIYLSLQTLSVSTNILAYWWKQSYLRGFGSHHLRDQGNKDQFNTAQIIQFIALGAIVIGYGASVIDALIGFYRLPLEKQSS